MPAEESDKGRKNEATETQRSWWKRREKKKKKRKLPNVMFELNYELCWSPLCLQWSYCAYKQWTLKLNIGKSNCLLWSGTSNYCNSEQEEKGIFKKWEMKQTKPILLSTRTNTLCSVIRGWYTVDTCIDDSSSLLLNGEHWRGLLDRRWEAMTLL